MSRFLAPKRPRTVTITLWGVFLLGTWNVGRVFALGEQSRLLIELGVTFDPRLRLVVALICAIAFWGLALSLWQKRPFARRAIPLFLTVYGLWEIGVLLLFAVPAARRGWMLNGLFYVGSILFTYWALNRSAADKYFASR